jgi:enoyl-CoA hydratase/carnithine racemase
MGTQDRLVVSEQRGPVRVLTLNNPPANAYSYPMLRALDEAILEARLDPETHALVLAGAGERFFCAGADIAMLVESTPAFKYAFCLHANETLERLERTPKLCIAALSGHAVGGGLEVALACDLRIARRGSGRTGLPEVQLGVLPGTGGTQRLARLAGRSRAIELMATGRLVDYDEAKTLGVVNDVWDADGDPSFLGAVVAYARRLCPPEKPSGAIGLMKRAVLGGIDGSLDLGLALERELQQRLFTAPDAREGLEAYTAKRAPRFTGP